MDQRAERRIFFRATLLFLASLAAALTWWAGHRGYFALDQCMVVDGGWRTLLGQVQYRDFGAPFGPFVFWVQAAMQWLLGAAWAATVMPAAMLSALAVVVAALMMRGLVGRGAPAFTLFGAACAGLVANAPFGTLWFENTALFLVFAAITLLLREDNASRGRTIACVLAGIAAMLAFLSKQNVPAFFAPAMLGAMLPVPWSTQRAIRTTLAFAAGVAGTAMLYALSLFATGALDEALYHLFTLPSLIAGERLVISKLLPRTVWSFFALGIAPSLFVLDRLLRRPDDGERSRWPRTVAVVAGLSLGWHVLAVTTMNEPINTSWGLVMPLAIAAAHVESLLRVSGRLGVTGRSARLITPAACIATIAVVMWMIPRIADRRVQQFPVGTRFADRLRITGYTSLAWGDSTFAVSWVSKTPVVLRHEDLEATYRTLAAAPGDFLVLGDNTCLYSMVGRRSRGVLLYLMRDHSYARARAADADSAMVAELAASPPAFVVRESATFVPDVTARPDDFPKLMRFIHARYGTVARHGPFEILRLR